MHQILAIDDDLNFLNSLSHLLKYKNYHIEAVSNPFEGIARIEKHRYQCLLLDVQMPGIDGLSLLEIIKQKRPELPVIMISGRSTLSIAANAIKQGAFDFLEKGADLDRLLISLRNAINHYNWQQQRSFLLKEISKHYPLIGQSNAMEKVRAQIVEAAATDDNVLITGEPGTGKESVARAIYFESGQFDNPLIHIHCAAMPEETQKQGLAPYFKVSADVPSNAATDGFVPNQKTFLFMDEVAALSLPMQETLLRLIEDSAVRDDHAGRRGVRIIATTNSDLRRTKDQGKFSEQLLNRLGVFPIHIPPFRERADDIPLIAEHFLTQFARKFNKMVFGISEQGQEMLKQYDWPTNGHGLRKVIEKAVSLANSAMVSAEEIALSLELHQHERAISEKRISVSEFLRKQERQFLHYLLLVSEGNPQKAAELSGMEFSTLSAKLREHGMTA